MDQETKYLNASDFIDDGYLYELNRLFLHPLGLAAEVELEIGCENEPVKLRILDYRDDKYGMYYRMSAEDVLTFKCKAHIFNDIRTKKQRERAKALGFNIQPLVEELREL